MLLSLESTYPPAHQLSLDMLKVTRQTRSVLVPVGFITVFIVFKFPFVRSQRLSTANDEIVEVLLSKQQVLGALRFIRSVGAFKLVSLS